MPETLRTCRSSTGLWPVWYTGRSGTTVTDSALSGQGFGAAGLPVLGEGAVVAAGTVPVAEPVPPPDPSPARPGSPAGVGEPAAPAVGCRSLLSPPPGRASQLSSSTTSTTARATARRRQ